MEILIVGCGSIGQRHARNLQEVGGIRLSAFDPIVERARAFAAEFGMQLVEHVEDGLQSASAALICSPPHVHTELAAKAVEASCHVFVEKPIASSLDGIDAVLSAASERKRVFSVGYNLRFDAGLRTVKQLLEDGAIGKLLMIRAEAG